jgi:plasmid replication initiation protein
MEVSASLVTDAESLELVQPGERALYHPTHLPQPGTVGDAASGDQRFDATLPQQATVLVEVVAAVGVQAPGLAARAPTQTPDRRDGIQ